MADYSKLSSAIIEGILNQYGFEAPVKIIPQSHGISNSNYVLHFEKAEPILLKVSNDKDLVELQKEQEILLELKNLNFDFSLTPYLNNEGKPVYQFEDLHGVIFPFVNGTVPALNKPNLAELAKGLATLHSLKSTNMSLRDHTEVGFDLKTINNFSKHSDCPKDFAKTFQAVFEKRNLNSLLETNWERGLIHGDLYFDNSLFEKQKLCKLIDFEQAGRGELILDLGISLSGSCLHNNEVSLELVDHYISHYETIRPLPSVEQEYLFDFIHIGLFSIALWRIKRFLTGDLDATKANSYKELIERSLQFHETHK